jgi:hypothetical protein
MECIPQYKRQLTYKFIANNNPENTKAPITLFSLKCTQNSLKLNYNRQSAKHSDSFLGVEIVQGRWQHGEEVGYWYSSRLEKTICKWHTYVPLVTKGFRKLTEMS